MTAEAPDRNESPDSTSPTLRDLLVVLFRQRRVAGCTFLVVLLLTGAYAWITPAYQAHMKVLLRRGRVDPVVTAEPNSPIALTHPDISEEELNSEVELLRDQELLQKVVEQNRLADKANESNNGNDVQVARAVRKLSGRLRVDAIRKTNLISVTYEASDPALAARVLNTLLAVYLAKHKAVRRSSEELPFFEQETTRSRAQLDAAETRLLDFSQDLGVVSGALERDLALQRTSEIESGHQQVIVSIQETSRRAQDLRARLRSLPERSTADMPYDIVHYHTLGPALFSFIPRLAGKKTAVTVQGLDWQRKKWGAVASAVLRFGEYAAVRFPHETMVVSKTLRSYYREHYGARTRYVANGARSCATSNRPKGSAKWGWSRGTTFFFSAGFRLRRIATCWSKLTNRSILW